MWWVHAKWCVADAPPSAPACKAFWTGTTVAGAVIGVFVAWKLLAWLVKPLRLWLEQRRRLAREAMVADDATMAQYKVDDSKLYSGPSQEDVEQRIRDALLEKKLTDQQRPHRPKKP